MNVKESKNKLQLQEKVTPEILLKAKKFGFSDKQLAYIWNADETAVRMLRRKWNIAPVFKTVDTCAAEFEASTPYHYSTYERENESVKSERKKVIILGGGPNRIGQGIEFDYCCVHGVMALQEEGYETIMINCNPETVSTDYDTTDKLYFEPLTLEDVLNICEYEEPYGIIVSFGGQTPLKIAKDLETNGVRILGTSAEGIDIAEDRERFGALLRKLNIPHPKYGTAYTVNNAVLVAEQIGFPVLIRPSYVLGGRAMEVCYTKDAVREYMRKAVDVSPDHPVLIDRFLEDAAEFDVDCVSDGKDVLIGGIMEHIEEAGIHSGDSACALPPYKISDKCYNDLIAYTIKLAKALKVIGLMNVQYAMKDETIYVLEVNPRASRTVPFVSKSTGIPLAKIAAKIMVGKTLEELGYKNRDYRAISHVAVKEAVFPFAKFPRTPVFLGPEMRSTGEVMGISQTFGESIAKSQIAAGNALPVAGTVFLSVNDRDKNERTINIARELLKLGFSLVATEGTAKFLKDHDISCERIYKINEGRPNSVDYIKNGKIQLIVSTPLGETSRTDEYTIGWSAIEYKVPYFTTLTAAEAGIKAIEMQQKSTMSVKSIQEYLGIQK
ncbi:MAG: carbamoyl-phosphate synthase large subunit [Bacteroidetes bacterium]|nr:carbamoyl-phosphate synthase large subunit [Bacteroidota bacterium]